MKHKFQECDAKNITLVPHHPQVLHLPLWLRKVWQMLRMDQIFGIWSLQSHLVSSEFRILGLMVWLLRDSSHMKGSQRSWRFSKLHDSTDFRKSLATSHSFKASLSDHQVVSKKIGLWWRSCLWQKVVSFDCPKCQSHSWAHRSSDCYLIESSSKVENWKCCGNLSSLL